MKKVIFTTLMAMCASSSTMAHAAMPPADNSMPSAAVAAADNRNGKATLDVDMDITVDGNTYHVQGEMKISMNNKSAAMDIAITPPEGKPMHFDGTDCLTSMGACVVNGTVTDESGKTLAMSEYRKLIKAVAAQLLQDDVSIIEGTMTNERGDTIDIAPNADLLLQIANQILQGEQ